MRLIDIDKTFEEFNSNEKYKHNVNGLVHAIRDSPTIYPVKHGIWIESEIPCEKFACSACGGAAWYYDYDREIRKSRYCPNCGAKMLFKNESN